MKRSEPAEIVSSSQQLYLWKPKETPKKIVCKLLQGFIRLDYVVSEERAKTIAGVWSGLTSLN